MLPHLCLWPPLPMLHHLLSTPQLTEAQRIQPLLGPPRARAPHPRNPKLKPLPRNLPRGRLSVCPPGAVNYMDRRASRVHHVLPLTYV
jgi:hypothetical protein